MGLAHCNKHDQRTREPGAAPASPSKAKVPFGAASRGDAMKN